MRVKILVLLLCALSSPAVSADELAATRRVAFSLSYLVVPRDVATQVTLIVTVPRTVPDRQKVLSVKCSPRPDRFFEENGNRYAQFTLRNFARPVEVRLDVEAELYRYDLSVASERKRPARPESAAALKRWLAAERYVEKNAPEIRTLARQVTGKTDREMVGSIAEIVRKSLRYSGFNERDVGALGGLKAGGGDCTEFSDLFVALCRARNIPARVWEGYVTTEVQAGDTPNHVWADVYFKDLGWVPVDPLPGALGTAPLDQMRTVYVYVSDVRNDPVLHGSHALYFAYRGRPVEVRSQFRVGRQEDVARP
jgi:transglutaminase-like putative cysteine protease